MTLLMEGQNEMKTKWKHYLFSLILLLYPLRHIRFGVEWTDTGYNYGNFMFMDNMDPMWVFSTYFGTALGNLFTKLPFGNYMMGLNVYTGLTVSILALLGYYFFTRRNRIPAEIVFAGEFLAINLCAWCPTALLYNFLTYIFMAIGVIALYHALMTDKKHLFVIAGLFLGINIFVRFPNLAEMAFILAVWAFGIIQKKKFIKVASETGWCLLGYVIGIVVCLGFITLRYGLEEYVAAITRLLNMPSGASDYSLYSMIYGQINVYIENLRWLRYLVLVVLVGILMFAFIPQKFIRVKQVAFIGGICVSFYLLYIKGMFVLEYASTRSMFEWAVFFLIGTLVVGAITIFNPKALPEEKLQAGLCILIILITPLGSNNHLFSSMNNLYIVAPFTLWMLFRFIKSFPQKVKLFKTSITIFIYPVKAMIFGILLMVGIQGVMFGATYVFTEAHGGKDFNTKIENNDILRGMLLDTEHAVPLESISAYVTENKLKGKEVILYGYIPAMSYYLEMPFAITSWPDLRSYNYEVMESDLQLLAKAINSGDKEVPIVILEKAYGENVKTDDKYTLLSNWMEQYSYQMTFVNEKFMIYQNIVSGM